MYPPRRAVVGAVSRQAGGRALYGYVRTSKPKSPWVRLVQTASYNVYRRVATLLGQLDEEGIFTIINGSTTRLPLPLQSTSKSRTGSTTTPTDECKDQHRTVRAVKSRSFIAPADDALRKLRTKRSRGNVALKNVGPPGRDCI